MKSRAHYERLFQQYPDVVTLPEFQTMLGGIGDSTARKIMRANKVKHFYIKDDKVRARIDNMRKLLNTDTASQIDDAHLAISYVYQTRHSEELNADEESYIYYAFIQQNGYEYLIQFTTNYTVPGSKESAYGVKGRSQAECKAAFEDIVINHILAAEK